MSALNVCSRRSELPAGGPLMSTFQVLHPKPTPRKPVAIRKGGLIRRPLRGVAELGQLQDHYHQNDDDQDSDDDPDNSSIHFASLRFACFGSGRWTRACGCRRSPGRSVQQNLANIGDQRGFSAEVLGYLPPQLAFG
jgi:hypothetical protein